MISILRALKGSHGQREQTPAGKSQGDRVLQLSPINNFLKSYPCSKLGRGEVVSALSLEACEQRLDDHFAESQRVDE